MKFKNFLNESPELLDHVVAGALYDFCGWLTTREQQLKMSSADDCAPVAEAIQEFLKMRGVDTQREPMIRGWEGRCSGKVSESSDDRTGAEALLQLVRTR